MKRTKLLATTFVALEIVTLTAATTWADPGAPKNNTDTPSRPEALVDWLQGKEVVEVCFAGPWMEPLKLRDSLRTTNLVVTPGEGRGGSFVEVCTTTTPAQVQALLSLQAELAPRGYSLDPAGTHIWSYPGDAEARRKARALIPEILSAAATGITQALPSVTTSRPRPDRLTYNIPGTNINGYLRITEITPAKEWTLDALGGDDQQFHLPHVGLMVLARCIPGTSDAPSAYRSPQRFAIRKAIEKAVEPLLKLESSPIVYPDPPWGRPQSLSQPPPSIPH